MNPYATPENIRSEWAEQYRQWEKLCRTLGRPDLTSPEREAAKRDKRRHSDRMVRLELLLRVAG